MVVVIWIPNTLRCIKVNTGMSAVLRHVGGDGHGCPCDRFTVGEMNDSIDQILEVIAITYLDVYARVSVAKRRDVGRCKRGEKHQQHQENWLCFRVWFV